MNANVVEQPAVLAEPPPGSLYGLMQTAQWLRDASLMLRTIPHTPDLADRHADHLERFWSAVEEMRAALPEKPHV